MATRLPARWTLFSTNLLTQGTVWTGHLTALCFNYSSPRREEKDRLTEKQALYLNWDFQRWILVKKENSWLGAACPAKPGSLSISKFMFKSSFFFFFTMTPPTADHWLGRIASHTFSDKWNTLIIAWLFCKEFHSRKSIIDLEAVCRGSPYTVSLLIVTALWKAGRRHYCWGSFEELFVILKKHRSNKNQLGQGLGEWRNYENKKEKQGKILFHLRSSDFNAFS